MPDHRRKRSNYQDIAGAPAHHSSRACRRASPRWRIAGAAERARATGWCGARVSAAQAAPCRSWPNGRTASMVIEDREAAFARALAGVRRRRPDRPRVPAGDLIAGHRPAAGAAFGFRAPCRARESKIEMAVAREGRRKRFRGMLTGRRGRRRASCARKDAPKARPATCCCRSPTWPRRAGAHRRAGSANRCGGITARDPSEQTNTPLTSRARE